MKDTFRPSRAVDAQFRLREAAGLPKIVGPMLPATRAAFPDKPPLERITLPDEINLDQLRLFAQVAVMKPQSDIAGLVTEVMHRAEIPASETSESNSDTTEYQPVVVIPAQELIDSQNAINKNSVEFFRKTWPGLGAIFDGDIPREDTLVFSGVDELAKAFDTASADYDD